MAFSVKRKNLDRIIESVYTDAPFESMLNPPDTKYYKENRWYSNPERIPYTPKQYLDALLNHGILLPDVINSGVGLFVFLTKQIQSINKGKVPSNGMLQGFIIEVPMLKILFKDEVIKQIEDLKRDVELQVAEEEELNVNNYIQEGLEFVCDESQLTLSIVISTYVRTYGVNNTGSGTDDGLQLELSYTFDNCSQSTPELIKKLKYCTVRLDADRFINYLKTYQNQIIERVEEKHKEIIEKRRCVAEEKAKKLRIELEHVKKT